MSVVIWLLNMYFKYNLNFNKYFIEVSCYSASNNNLAVKHVSQIIYY